MFPINSIAENEDFTKYVDITNAADRSRVRAECRKLEYLTTYPNVVKGKMEAKSAEIRGLGYEISLEVNSSSSELARIKRRQELKPRYQLLETKHLELEYLREELVYAVEVKTMAEAKLRAYKGVLGKHKQRGVASGE